MVLDADCVRAVLIAIESTGFGEKTTIKSLMQKLPSYTEEQLWYTTLKLSESGYLDVVTIKTIGRTVPGIKMIKGLTFDGHTFLNSIRDESSWGKIKTAAQKAGVFSVKMIFDIAQAVASSALSSLLQ